MDHSADSKLLLEGAARALVTALLACVVLLAAAPSALAEPAVDEYKLDYSGSDRARLSDLDSTEAVRDRSRSLGVIGEDAPALAPLAATGSMLTSAPLLVAALVAALAAVAFTLRSRGARI